MIKQTNIVLSHFSTEERVATMYQVDSDMFCSNERKIEHPTYLPSYVVAYHNLGSVGISTNLALIRSTAAAFLSNKLNMKH